MVEIIEEKRYKNVNGIILDTKREGKVTIFSKGKIIDRIPRSEINEVHIFSPSGLQTFKEDVFRPTDKTVSFSLDPESVCEVTRGVRFLATEGKKVVKTLACKKR